MVKNFERVVSLQAAVLWAASLQPRTLQAGSPQYERWLQLGSPQFERWLQAGSPQDGNCDP